MHVISEHPNILVRRVSRLMLLLTLDDILNDNLICKVKVHDIIYEVTILMFEQSLNRDYQFVRLKFPDGSCSDAKYVKILHDNATAYLLYDILKFTATFVSDEDS